MAKIHGHTSIVLKNVKTGMIDRVESDNVFQSSVLQNFWRTNGVCLTYPSDITWVNMVGGIFLFKNAIQEGSEFMPAGNVMIGNGSYGVANNSEPNEFGTYNAVESSASASAITQVYDFETNQANGTIGCVCLTSRAGGYIGYGNATNNGKSDVAFGDYQSHIRNFDITGCTDGKYTYILGKFNNGNLIVEKKRYGLTNMSVFNDFSKISTFDILTVGDDVFGIANATGNIETYVSSIYNNKIRFVPNLQDSGVSHRYAGAGERFYYYEYDVVNDTMELKYFTNPSTNTLDNYVSDRFGHTRQVFLGKYCVVSANNGKTEIIDTTNSALMYEYNTNNSTWNYDYMPTEPMDGFIDLGGATPYLLDTSTWVAKRCNIKDSGGIWYQRQATLPNICKKRFGAVIRHNPLYLATINNLQTAVTKTAAQTMKVTYTLTEEEPE